MNFMDFMSLLSEGVYGNLFPLGNVALITDIWVPEPLRRKGLVTSFLKELGEDYSTVVVANVIGKDLQSLLRKMGYRYYGVKSFDPGNSPASFYVKSSEDFDLKEFLESLPDREVMPIWVNKGEE